MECGKASHDSHIVTKYDIGHISSHMSQSQYMMRKTYDGNNMRTTGGCCTATRVKCISSIQNQIGTLLSSPCQLWLRVDLSHHG